MPQDERTQQEEPQKKVDEEWKAKVEQEKKNDQPADTQAEPKRPPMPEANFANFIATLRLQVLVTLGDVPNPATQQTERDLQQAKYLIDTLQILQEKTKGNLEDAEQQLLQNILYEARMRYVDAASRPAGDTENESPATQPE